MSAAFFSLLLVCTLTEKRKHSTHNASDLLLHTDIYRTANIQIAPHWQAVINGSALTRFSRTILLIIYCLIPLLHFSPTFFSQKLLSSNFLLSIQISNTRTGWSVSSAATILNGKIERKSKGNLLTSGHH